MKLSERKIEKLLYWAELQYSPESLGIMDYHDEYEEAEETYDRIYNAITNVASGIFSPEDMDIVQFQLKAMGRK
jgi:hypothetical protein